LVRARVAVADRRRLRATAPIPEEVHLRLRARAPSVEHRRLQAAAPEAGEKLWRVRMPARVAAEAGRLSRRPEPKPLRMRKER
jgi:hypothetical protein